jgi:hypothetical protein
MASGRYEPRMVRANPDYHIMEWVTEEGIPVGDGVEMTEQELRSALKMKWSRTDTEIDQLISEAQGKFAA